LFAKGIVYQRNPYKLVGMPYLKIYNFGENENARRHVKECLYAPDVSIFFTEKLDGTLISRNVIDGKVVFSTRGTMETFLGLGEGQKFFDKTRELAETKYPKLLDVTWATSTTLMFELVGPENRIITFYKEWDLVLTGAFDFGLYRYLTRLELFLLATSHGLRLAEVYQPQGSTVEEKIASMNAELLSTDLEGAVIQFEFSGEVVGRIKAKSDTYRTMLRLSNNCNYDTVVELCEKHPEISGSWKSFERHLKELGRFNFPEELFDSYREFYTEYFAHKVRCDKFLRVVAGNCDRVFHEIRVKDYTKGLNRDQRKEFAVRVAKLKFPSAYFAFLDDKLTLEYLMKQVLKDPELSRQAVG
jgi:hypothetical protein